MRGLVFLGALLLGACGLAGRHTPDTPAPPTSDPTVSRLALPAHSRVMVFAPHPDDETIAVGGLIHRLTRQGVPVKVVFVTSGDGYRRALEQSLAVQQPTDADYLALGQRREQEARAAAHQLGLPRANVSFLGFPDNGLEALWQAHWLRTDPYTSPFTKEGSPPYPDTVNPDVDYDGQDLLSVLSRLLQDWKPSVVVIPHPYDRHSDHVHTSYFVIEAVTSLRDHGVLVPSPMILTYLVHYPNWPSTRGPRWDHAYPLANVEDTYWTGVDLSSGDLAAKRAALTEYKTQLGAMAGFLQSFLTHNELYGLVDGELLARIASVH